MEWNGPLRNAEVRLDALKFNQREELEALQLTNIQWRCCVYRYSSELALRPVKSVELDLRTGSTFRLGEAENQTHVFNLSDEISNDDSDEKEDDDDANVDFDSAEFDEEVRGAVKALMTTSNCTRLNYCFVERLTLQRSDIASETFVIAFGKDFCVWIKALRELEADVHVRTLKLVGPSYDNMSLDSVYKRLDEVLHVQEYFIRKHGGARRGDELCVDVFKKAKRVTIMGYYLAEGDDGRYTAVLRDDDAEGQDVAAAKEENDDQSRMNGCEQHVLDFVFGAPQCEELYLSGEYYGSQLPNILIQRFQGLESASQMVATFTWQWYAEDDCDTDAWPEPICHEGPFKTPTHLSRRPRGKYLGYPKGTCANAREPGRGYVYQFRNEHDGSYLTVVKAPGDARVLQFQKGKFEFDDAAEDASDAKKQRLNDVSN